MLQRKAYNILKLWKDTKTRQGLLVTGARQVGKTFLIRAFAREHYKRLAEINLVENKRAAAAIEGAETATDLFMRLSLLSETELVPGETLIFIDEVQICKETVTAIKFLVEQNDFDFVISGSLLGVELKNIRSVPVGYLDVVMMYPLDFREYCLARNVPADAAKLVDTAFSNREPVPDFLHEHLQKLFYEYLIIGGMPAAVAEFVKSKNLQAVRRIQENLILQNKQDISRYNEKDSLIIKDIYDLIPAELNSQNKRFVLKNMNEHARYGRYQDCFVWLADAGVALPTYNVDDPAYPLKLSQASNLFKLFMADVGMLTGTFLKDVSIEILNRNPNVNYGSIYENAVAQELKAHGFDLYYYKNKKLGEVDFMIETVKGQVFPIEVKFGKDYKRHKAINNLLERDAMPEGFVLYDGNLRKDGKVTYLPVYMTGCLAITK